MKTHTFARLFPAITGPDFDALVADIKANGLREKITTLGGMILDGQNRFLACEAAGVKPEYEPYEGQDPLAYVVSKNMARRHLTDDQRAAIAAEIAKAGPGKLSNLDSFVPEPTANAAATMLKVSVSKVRKAKAVKRESPKAFKAVKEGKLSLNAAHEQKHPRQPKPEPEPLPAPVNPVTTLAERWCPPEHRRPAMTLHRWVNELAILEFEVNEVCAGNQQEREKFGVIANALAGRLMNPPQPAGIYTR